MKSGLIFKADQTVVEFAPANGEDYTLEELQKSVGGYIEIVTLTEDVIMVVNEEGKGALEPNGMATALAKGLGAIFPHDYIAGNAVLCASDMVK